MQLVGNIPSWHNEQSNQGLSKEKKQKQNVADATQCTAVRFWALQFYLHADLIDLYIGASVGDLLGILYRYVGESLVEHIIWPGTVQCGAFWRWVGQTVL